MREMKDSGIEWLGEIPAGWDVDRFSSLFACRNEKVSDVDYEPLSVTKGGVLPQLSHVAKSDDHANRKLVRGGDFAINSRSDRRNSCGFASQDGSVSLINTVCTPRKKFDSRYYAHLFDTSQWADEFYSWGHGIVADLWTTGWNDMKRIALPVPPIDEQRRIAGYLDEKCAEIDRAISAAEQSIEEYKAYITSMIACAISSRDAQRVKLSFFAESVLGKMLDQAQQKGINTHRYLANKDVQWFRLETDKLAEMDFPGDSQVRYGIQDGDILVCEGGEVGRCSVYRGESPDFYFQKAIHRVRVNQEIAYPEYIVYQMFAKAKTGNFMEVRKGQATFNHLTGEQLRQLRFLLPPLAEQRRIADYLDDRCFQIGSAIAAKQATISDLKAYKQSLIYEVVTGKREV